MDGATTPAGPMPRARMSTDIATRPGPDVGPGRRMSVFIQAARPRQWSKNVLVLAAPAAAGVLGRDDVLVAVLVMVVAFCLLASAGYLVNDALDAEEDRLHPRKRLRPVASGALPRNAAVLFAAIGFAAGLGLCAAVGWDALGVGLAYVTLTLTYSLWLKREPVVEMLFLAGAFVLRAAAGGAAAQVRLSGWFVVVVSFGALFVVAGKRQGELSSVGADAGTRGALTRYPLTYLRYLWMMSSTVAVSAYCLWAFSQASVHSADRMWLEASIAPFTFGVVKYALLIEEGGGGAPEEVFLRDRGLQLAGIVWVGLYMTGVYVIGV